jgi:hypothetical protein
VFRVLEPVPLEARVEHGRRNFFGGGSRTGAGFRVFKVGFPSILIVSDKIC